MHNILQMREQFQRLLETLRYEYLGTLDSQRHSIGAQVNASLLFKRAAWRNSPIEFSPLSGFLQPGLSGVRKMVEPRKCGGMVEGCKKISKTADH